MAGENFAGINPVLSSIFTRVMMDQVNRRATGLSRIRAVPCDSGKNIQWGAKFTNAKAASAVAEGSDVGAGEYGTNAKVPATLTFPSYRCPASVSDEAVILSADATGSPEAVMNLLEGEVRDSILTLTKLINVDIYTGTGTSGGGQPNIIGLYGGAALSTGTYANISRVTYAEWAGNELANGSIDRPITDDLMRQAEQQAWEGGGSKPNLILTSGGVHRKYAGLFAPIQRVQTGGAMPTPLAMGSNDLFWSNMEVVRDVDAPVKKLAMINTDEVELVYPSALRPIMTAAANIQAGRSAPARDGDQTFGFPVLVQEIARTGSTIKLMVWTMVQLRVKRPNATALILDISES